MSYLNTTFILGAGASCHTGAPLISNFLTKAMKVMDELEGKDDDLYRIFDQVFVYIAKNDAMEALLNCSFGNIEDVFGLLDLEARVQPASKPTRDALLKVILHTLERTTAPEVRQKFCVACDGPRDVAELDSTPSEVLVSLVANRAANNTPNSPSRNAIISLNYDTLLERAMAATRVLEPEYGAPDLNQRFSVPPRARIQLFKLHGSMNWRTCSKCKSIKVLGLSAPVGEKVQCCEEMQPLLVPPSWDKAVHALSLERVWQEAFSHLRNSRRWVFIGTSLAPTDQYLRYLFAVALRHNVYLRHVTVVDPGDGANIRKLFEGSASRVRVEHLSARMVPALGGEGMPSPLFREVGCLANTTADPYQW